MVMNTIRGMNTFCIANEMRQHRPKRPILGGSDDVCNFCGFCCSQCVPTKFPMVLQDILTKFSMVLQDVQTNLEALQIGNSQCVFEHQSLKKQEMPKKRVTKKLKLLASLIFF
jgi:hypothetical protein